MKAFAISLFLFAICGSAFAQSVKIAPVLGPSVTIPMLSKEMRDLYTDDYFGSIGLNSTGKFPPVVRLQAGALVDYEISESLSLQSGLIFNFRGFTYKVKGTYTDGGGKSQTLKAKTTASITYLEIPVWLSYRLGDTGFKIIGGPGFGFAVGGTAKSKASAAGESDSDSDKLEIGSDPDTDDVKPFDLNVNIGIAKEITLADRPLEISLFAQPSITKWNPVTADESQYFARHFNAGIRVAYFFSLR